MKKRHYPHKKYIEVCQECDRPFGNSTESEGPGIKARFERESINLMDGKGKLALFILASFAK